MQSKLHIGVEECLSSWIFIFLKLNFRQFLKIILNSNKEGVQLIYIQLHVFLKTGFRNLAHMDRAIFYFPKICLDRDLLSYLGKPHATTAARPGWHSQTHYCCLRLGTKWFMESVANRAAVNQLHTLRLILLYFHFLCIYHWLTGNPGSPIPGGPGNPILPSWPWAPLWKRILESSVLIQLDAFEKHNIYIKMT